MHLPFFLGERCGCENGPPCGSNLDVFTVAIDPSNSDIVYAGTFGGGVFRSTNGGTNWTEVKGLGVHFIDTLAFDPNDPSHLYAGTLGGGVFEYQFPRVTNPSGPDIMVIHGTTMRITCSGFDGPLVRMELRKGGNIVWSSGVGNTGLYDFKIYKEWGVGSDYRIRITSVAHPSQTDDSDQPFKIVAGDPKVISPKAGEQLKPARRSRCGGAGTARSMCGYGSTRVLRRMWARSTLMMESPTAATSWERSLRT